MMDKSELRKEIRNRKRQYTKEDLQRLSLPVINRLRNHPKLKAAHTVMLYHSLPDEVDTHNFVDEMVAAGKRVLLPVVISETEMEIRHYTGPEDMAESSFHILEPVGELFTDYEQIEFIAVPGMSSPRRGDQPPHAVWLSLGHSGSVMPRSSKPASTMRLTQSPIVRWCSA